MARPDDQRSGANDDLKEKMRAALERKNSRHRAAQDEAPLREKAHGSEVVGGGPRMHRRKAGGGGS